MNYAFLGESSSFHWQNIKSLFNSVDKDIYLIKHVLSDYMYSPKNGDFSRVSNRIRRINEQLTGIKDGSKKDNLKEILYKHSIDCVLAYWGINPISDIITIKKLKPDTKVILNVLCHPTGLSTTKIFLQNKFFELSSKYLDGIIYSNYVMKDYFEKRILHKRGLLPDIIFPPLLSKQYFPEEIKQECAYTPNLIFLGRMDWWVGQVTDNVHKQIDALMDVGIHIFHSDKTGKLSEHPNRHIFRPMEIHELKNYATQFDASLMIYNLSGCKRNDRFRITIPDRLIAGVSFGLPIAIPAKGYDASREFLKEYKAVIEFESVGELLHQLRDRKRVEELKLVAQENSHKYCAEAYFGYLLEFIEKICQV
jgi:hypothetical protein